MCTDLDGTLLASNGKISFRNIKAIQELAKRNVKIALASGRPEDSLKQFTVRDLRVPTYKICFNGALIVSPEGKVINETLIDSESVLKIVSLAEKNAISVNFSTLDKWINFDPIYDMRKIDKYNETLTDIRVHTFDQMRQLLSDRKIQILKVGMHISDSSLLKKMDSELSQIAINVFHSDREFLEATAKKASKFMAIKEISSVNNWNLKNVMAFGDYENDLEMIANVGHGVAMKNGIKKVQKAAEFVTDTNDKNGIALVLNSVMKNGNYPKL
ncbi:HAD superfamily hydrolase [Pediococcus ethanolidurans]|nr:HAD family hydrolase [Pediococcus ethanolidurans]KRN83565.1 HAD superfamily hydrolase [Pediococcus ethanolidurans]